MFRVENITMSGSVDSDRIRPSATTSGSTLTFIRFERPDGVSSDGDDAEGMFVPNTHAGELWLVDCWIEGFADNGLYASVPGNSDGAGGSTHVRGGLYRNNNVANLFDWAVPVIPVKGAVSVHDGRAPVHSNGGHLQRGSGSASTAPISYSKMSISTTRTRGRPITSRSSSTLEIVVVRSDHRFARVQ